MNNALCHFELMTGDVTSCRAFYGAIFGWRYDEESMPGYTLVHTGQEPTGGIFPKPSNGVHPCVNIYFSVGNIDETLEAVNRSGGKTLVPKTAIPGVGHFAMFADPEGVSIGIMEAVG